MTDQFPWASGLDPFREMGQLRNTTSGRMCVLEAEHVVGRSARCELCIDRPEVSSQHALLRWNGKSWEVRDLNSKNGTFVDGVRLGPGTEHPLTGNSSLRFGHDDEIWFVTDAEPPRVMALELDGSHAVAAEGTILAVPSNEQPDVTIYMLSTGEWCIERPNEPTRNLTDRDVFEAGGKRWRFSCPSIVARTQAVGQSLELRQAEFVLRVSSDEEYVELQVRCRGLDLSLGERAHHYLLLTLARTRLAETQRGVPETLAGWVYQDELARALDLDQPRLNLEIFRLRKQLASKGFADAATVIERRSSTKQLRAGVTRTTIVRV